MNQDIKVTVDTVVFDISRDIPHILLIRRKNDPFKGQWALPGGFVEPDENLETAARRELEEETGICPSHVSQFRAFGEPGRDPRGPTVSVAHYALVDHSNNQALPGSDAEEAKWFSLDGLPQLAFDHADIIACARRSAEI